MTVRTNKVEAQARLKKLAPHGAVRGGSYFRDKNTRCAIGWLAPEDVASRWEDDPHRPNYPSVSMLIQDGDLIVPDDEVDWFKNLQRQTDYLSTALQTDPEVQQKFLKEVLNVEA